MSGHPQHTRGKIRSSLVIQNSIFAPAAVSAPTGSLTLSNWSESPVEVHAGDTVDISFEMDYSIDCAGNQTYFFVTVLTRAYWNYTVGMNNRLCQLAGVAGSTATSLPSLLQASENEKIRLRVHLKGTAPEILSKTVIPVVDLRAIPDGGGAGIQVSAFGEVIPKA